jgi:hypothetical protein
MRLFVLTVPFYCILLASTMMGLGNTYYASPTGTNTTNCAASNSDPLRLLDAIANCLRGGDTLVLRNSDQNNPYTLDSNPGLVLRDDLHSGNLAAHTVIKAENRDGLTWFAKLEYAGPPCQPAGQGGEKIVPVIIRVEASYIDIIDLDISSRDNNGGVGIALLGQNVTVQGNHIHHMHCRQGCVDGFNAGVVAPERKGQASQVGNHNIIRNVFDDISPYDNLNDPACQEDDAIFYRQMHGYIANNIVLHSAGNAISLRCNTGGTQEAPLYVVNNTISNVKGAGITYSGNDGPTGCSSGGCDVNAPAQTIEFLYTLNNIITCGADPLEFYDSGILESDATSIPPRPCRIGSTNWVDYNLTYMPNSNDPPGCPKNAWWVNVGLSNDTINNSGLTPDPNDPPRNPQGPNMFYMFYIYPPLYLINTGSLGPAGRLPPRRGKPSGE